VRLVVKKEEKKRKLMMNKLMRKFQSLKDYILRTGLEK